MSSIESVDSELTLSKTHYGWIYFMDNPNNVDKPNKMVEAGRGVPSEAEVLQHSDNEEAVRQTQATNSKNRLDERVRKAGI